ncbi:MAG TPA: outer membrane protein transport protein, partial [Rhodothermales bacterium]
MNGIPMPFQRRAIMSIAVLLSVFGSLQTVHAQTAEDAIRFTQRAPATGARMSGLAGAGLVGIADQSALILNPAGLAYFTRSELSAGLNILSTADEARYFTPAAGDVFERNLRDTGIGNIAWVYKVPTVTGSLVLAAAFNQVNTFDRNLIFEGENSESSISDSFLPFDDEYEVDFDNGAPFPRFFADTPELAYLGGAIEFLGEDVGAGYPFYQAVDPSTTIRQSGEVLEEGRLKELNFGGAVEALKGVMAGASLNLAFGSYRFRSDFDETDHLNQNGPSQYEIFLPNDTLRGFDQLFYTERLESDLVGVNARFGVSGAIGPSVRLGVTLETPTYYNVNEDYERIVETFFDEGGSLAHGGQPGDAGQGEFEYTITTPWRIGGGVAFAAVGLTVTADAEFVDWSQLRLDADTDQAYFEDVNRQIRDDYEGVWNTRVGLEYNIENLSLRGGIAFLPDPARDRIELRNGDELDRERTFFSLGASYKFADQLLLDFAWMQERFDDAYVPYG